MKSKNQVRCVEHQVLRTLRSIGCEKKKILIAVSGGCDSMVLLELLLRWQSVFEYELAVAYVHHGSGPRTQVSYRNRAQKLVRAFCDERNITFCTNEKNLWPEEILRSEAALRDFRWQKLQHWQAELGFHYVAVAHHLDDLLETQLLRLIRGTSVDGLKAMTQRDANRIRPLIGLSKAQLTFYAQKKCVWLDDPSNKNKKSLRNWLRLEWLSSLEKRLPGSKKSLARSLQLIAESGGFEAQGAPQTVWAKGGVLRKPLATMTKKQQSLVLVAYLRQLGLSEFQQSHVHEVLRRLDTNEKRSTFSLLGFSWTILPDLVLASRV